MRTGALGEMTTLGVIGWLCRLDAVEPAWPVLPPAFEPACAWCPWNMFWFGWACCCCWPGDGAPAWDWVGPSGPGIGLLRESTRFEVEDVGVACAEPAGDCVEPPCGEPVPVDESLDFLASLLPSPSFFRESCSCCQTRSSIQASRRRSERERDLPHAGESPSLSALVSRDLSRRSGVPSG
jgi:hypothetical protein